MPSGRRNAASRNGQAKTQTNFTMSSNNGIRSNSGERTAGSGADDKKSEEPCGIKALVPKHVPIPIVPVDGHLSFEALSLVVSIIATSLQMLNLYRTVWWLPHSYNNYSMNFYLIDPYLLIFIITMVARQFIYSLLRRIIDISSPIRWLSTAQKMMRITLLIIVMNILCWCLYHMAEKHNSMKIFYLCYPSLSVYFVMFGISAAPFFDISAIPLYSKDEKKTKFLIDKPLHNCSLNASAIRAEVSTLRSDFNRRLKRALFASSSSAYVCGIAPIIFVPQHLHFNVSWVVQHVIMFWLERISAHFTHAYPVAKECIMPEASQEGLLHSFKSYSDIVMFHYTVPKEVLRATWQFAAFMDGQECLERNVHIYLQWGSYPVIFINNDTFPSNMYPKRNHTIIVSTITTFEPKTTAIVPVYGPEAGDWFVGAYLSHWDEKVQQQGLGHKCHYSIGSVAIWTQINSIENIPIGYQQTLRTKETTSYYKIYIPSGTWNFRLDIWGCNFTVLKFHNIHEPCIKNMVLQGRSLPVFNHSQPIKNRNLTMLDSYTFIESSPYEDSYYYLMIVSDSIIEVNVKVVTFECPIRITEKSFIKQYLDAPSFSKALAQLHMKDLTNHLHYNENKNNESFYNGNNFKNQFHVLDENFDDSCVPRYQLVRIKHSQTFSGVYLLQGREWLTSWVMLTDIHPVITQFNILPLIDIGGTLDISAHLEMDKIITKQLVKVILCIRRGRIPNRIKNNIICENSRMSMILSSFDKHDGSLLIPYPQPDTWYVTLDATCYFNGRPVNCEMEEILVSLDIRTRQCVFPGNYPCGHHGTCQEIHRDILFYTTCKCFEGYKGWGCTDATSANSESSLLITTLMLTLSNGFFIPAIYLAVKRGLYTEGLVYLATMLFSSMYHACDQHVMTYCIAKYEVLQYSDFFSSILAFWVTLIAMAELPIHFVSVCHMFGVFIIAFGVQSNKTSLISILIPLGMAIMIPMGTYVYRCFHFKKWKKPINTSKLLAGLILAIIGLLLFSLVETESNYQYVHSAWHVIIAISLIFLLPPSRLEQIGSSDTSYDSELLDYKDPSSSPIFTITNGQEHLVIASN